MQHVNRKEKSLKNSSIFRVSMENNCSTLWVYILSTDLKCPSLLQERGAGESSLVAALWWLKKERERRRNKFAQSCLTLWDPMNCSPPDFSVHGSSWGKNIGGSPFPSPGDLLHPDTENGCPSISGSFFTIWASRESLGVTSSGDCGEGFKSAQI